VFFSFQSRNLFDDVFTKSPLTAAKLSVSLVLNPADNFPLSLFFRAFSCFTFVIGSCYSDPDFLSSLFYPSSGQLIINPGVDFFRAAFLNNIELLGFSSFLSTLESLPGLHANSVSFL